MCLGGDLVLENVDQSTAHTAKANSSKVASDDQIALNFCFPFPLRQVGTDDLSANC